MAEKVSEDLSHDPVDPEPLETCIFLRDPGEYFSQRKQRIFAEVAHLSLRLFRSERIGMAEFFEQFVELSLRKVAGAEGRVW